MRYLRDSTFELNGIPFRSKDCEISGKFVAGFSCFTRIANDWSIPSEAGDRSKLLQQELCIGVRAPLSTQPEIHDRSLRRSTYPR